MLSTVDDWESEVNPDGTVFVYVGKALWYATTGRRVGDPFDPTVRQLMIGPMGRLDNLSVKQQ